MKEKRERSYIIIKTNKDSNRKNTDPNTKVESNTGKKPEKDNSVLPPNPNKVDNH